MYKLYQGLSHRYRKISLREERRLISLAKRGSEEKANEIVLRHVPLVISRIKKKTVSDYHRRFGEDLLSEALFVLGTKIKSYNLRYKDKDGNPKPVRFASYVWKRIDGFIIDFLRREIERDRLEESLDL